MSHISIQDPQSKELQGAKRDQPVGDHWRLRLNSLIQVAYGMQNLHWEQFQAGPQHAAPWTAIVYCKTRHVLRLLRHLLTRTLVHNVEWGRGSSTSLSEAKEAAAWMAYRALYKEVYGTYPV